MNLLDLYDHLPASVQNIGLSLYGARLRHRRYGGIHSTFLGSIARSSAFSRDELISLQQRELFHVLVHALDTVPFYRHRGLARPLDVGEARHALREWPLLTKAAVQAAGRDMLSTAGGGGRLSTVHTGGTTGRALAISVSRAALQRNYAFFERQKRWAGIEAHDSVATFAGRTVVPASVRREPFWRHNYAANQLLLSSYHLAPDTVDAYIAGLAKFGPRLIDSYPSSLEPIARRIIERGDRPVRPAAIITSSETLDPAVRALFAKAFDCRVFDHYGSAEMVAFITQCNHGGYHVNPEYGILELLDDSGAPVADGQIGEIVATGFINHAMPLIRYRMGDSARMAAVPCTCGSAFPHVEAILGRTDDVIVTPDGRRVGRIDPIFKAVTSLHEARVVQTALDHVRLELVVGTGFRDADREELISGLRSRLGPHVRVECIEVPKIPRTQGGKLRTVVSQLNAHAPTERL
ncbi:MAG: hypothetical protein P3C10_00290 [Gemmatimonadota bacterium]|jgi:phenylacetate-CoA ligase|nr:hypothetical protein [Gemmatimonadota bacterium]